MVTPFWEKACPECAKTSRRSCARGRCYCGHPVCHAYTSWKPRRRMWIVPDPKRETAMDRW